MKLSTLCAVLAMGLCLVLAGGGCGIFASAEKQAAEIEKIAIDAGNAAYESTKAGALARGLTPEEAEVEAKAAGEIAYNDSKRKQQEDAAKPNFLEKAGDAVTKYGPNLPQPFGGLAAPIGALLTLIGGFFAGRARQAAFAEGGSAQAAALNPLVKLLAERKWLMPTVAGVIDAAALAGLTPGLDLGTLGLLNAALVLPGVGESIKDASTSAITKSVSSAGAPEQKAQDAQAVRVGETGGAAR